MQKLLSSVPIASKSSDGPDSSKNKENHQSRDDHTKKRSIIVPRKVPTLFSSEECKNGGSTIKERAVGNEKIPAKQEAESVAVNNIARVKTTNVGPVPGSNTRINARKSVKKVAGLNKGCLEPVSESKIGVCTKRDGEDNVPECKKQNPGVVITDVMEITREKLKQGYQKYEENKKRRRIQVIDVKDATLPPSNPKRRKSGR